MKSPLHALYAVMGSASVLGLAEAAIIAGDRPLLGAGLAVCAALTGVGGIICARRCSADIGTLTSVLDGASRGELEPRLLMTGTGSDPLANIARAINRCLDSVDAFVRESEASLAEVAQSRFHRRMVERGMDGSYRASARVINKMTVALEETVRSNRDLAVQFREAIARQVVAGTEIARQTHRDVEAMESASNVSVEQSAGVLAISRAVATSMESVADSTDALSAAISDVLRQVQDASDIASRAVHNVDQAHGVFSALSETSSKIGEVVKLIQGIAHQTNLLALNATIEAARAGDAGKGFAVVANEVKQLSHQTAQATTTISEHVSSIQGITARAVGAMEDIAATIRHINGISEQVTQSVVEQSAATETIAHASVSVRAEVQQAAAAIEILTTSAQQSSEIAARLFHGTSQVSANADELAEEVDGFFARVAMV